MSTLEIIELVALIVIAVALLVWFVAKGIKENWFKQIYDTLKQAIKEAEKKYPSGHGKEKLQYVLDEVKKKCDELKIPYMLIYKYIKKVIEQIIADYNVIKK